MPQTVQTVIDAITVALNDIPNVRAYPDIPDNITPTTIVVTLDRVPTYHGAQQDGCPIYRIKMTAIVDNLSNRTAYTTLNELASHTGARSVRATIDAITTITGVTDELDNVGVVDVGDIRYLACDWYADIYP